MGACEQACLAVGCVFPLSGGLFGTRIVVSIVDRPQVYGLIERGHKARCTQTRVFTAPAEHTSFSVPG